MPSVLTSVADYYTGKVRQHGAIPAGVDWNSEAGQILRFENLAKLWDAGAGPGRVDDYGCGYGAFFSFLAQQGRAVDYLGLDISAEMIALAQQRHGAERFVVGSRSPRQADYAVASGIFNVRLETPVAAWEKHVEDTLDALHAHTTRGFAFNCLTSYSDPEKRRSDLYYGDPCRYFDLCKRRYAKDVSLLHDYGLYEFTVLVKKNPAP